METEIIEVLNTKLIPDLVNIINDYTLTPFEYFGLIDEKKYITQEYQEYRDEYEKIISKQIIANYKMDSKFLFNYISINLENRTQRIEESKKLFDSYIKLLIAELKNANIFIIDNFKILEDRKYQIIGTDPKKGLLSVVYQTLMLAKGFKIKKLSDPSSHLEYLYFKSPLWNIYAEILDCKDILDSKFCK